MPNLELLQHHKNILFTNAHQGYFKVDLPEAWNNPISKTQKEDPDFGLEQLFNVRLMKTNSNNMLDANDEDLSIRISSNGLIQRLSIVQQEKQLAVLTTQNFSDFLPT